MVKWVIGDKGFYLVRIMLVIGFKIVLIYIVKFKSYDMVEMLRVKDIKFMFV